jgi:error-prone DNA polymerase
MATVPPDDPETYAMIRRADTVGVFQIESRAQMAMLPRLRPERFYDLVVEVSIVRPGPISGGMVHPYLKRRRGEEPVEYPHPSLEPVLEKTLGVPLFQEQVMKLAVVAADYTPGEADQLRRDMAAWRRTGRIEKHRARLVARMTAKGIRPEFAERVFEQIRGFGEYGFPESHAASFALISYATSYLKCHYPAEFACAILNAQPMGFYAPSTLVEDAKHHGVDVRCVDVGVSEWDCTLEPVGEDVLRARAQTCAAADADRLYGSDCRPGAESGRLGDSAAERIRGPSESPPVSRDPHASSVSLPFAVRMGLRYVKGMRETDWRTIAAARGERPFSCLEDFVRRTGIGEGVLLRLAEAGAFESLGIDRRAALWDGRRHVNAPERSLPLFDPPDDRPAFALLEPFETIGWDYRVTGHSTRGHPLETIRDDLKALGLPTAQELNGRRHGSRVRYAGAVICRQRPGTAKGVVFMTLEDETGFVNALLWPSVWEKCAITVKTNSLLGLSGRLEAQEGVVHLVVDRVWVPRLPRSPGSQRSRDFH